MELFQPVQRRTLDLAPDPTEFVARGNELHVFVGSRWYKLDEQL